VAAESVLGLPAVWPTLLDHLPISTRRHAGARRGGTEGSNARNALGNPTASCTPDAADRATGEAHSR
jgi:hypothetical protein